jgi:hypothetical protein
METGPLITGASLGTCSLRQDRVTQLSDKSVCVGYSKKRVTLAQSLGSALVLLDWSLRDMGGYYQTYAYRKRDETQNGVASNHAKDTSEDILTGHHQQPNPFPLG